MNIGLDLKKPPTGYRALGFVFDTSQPNAFSLSLALLFFTVGVKVDWNVGTKKA